MPINSSALNGSTDPAMKAAKNGAYDFIVNPKGEYFFLEVNPAGQWLWMEEKLNLNISKSIAEALMKIK